MLPQACMGQSTAILHGLAQVQTSCDLIIQLGTGVVAPESLSVSLPRVPVLQIVWGSIAPDGDMCHNGSKVTRYLCKDFGNQPCFALSKYITCSR